MRKRPDQLWQVAALLLAIALCLPLQVMVTYGYEPTEIPQILAGLAPLNWLVLILCVAQAALVYRASSWVLISTPIFFITVAWNNWVVAWAGLNYSTLVAFLATVGAMATHLPLIRGEARKAILNPKLRWWLTAPRKRVAVHTVIRPVMGGEIRSLTFDLSTGGAFIDLNKACWNPSEVNPKRHLKIGSRCSIRLMINQTQVLTCGAEIVRHAPSTGERPGGFAVRFVALDESQRRLLRSCMQKELSAATAA